MIFCANAGVWAGLVVAIEPVPVALAPVLAVLFIGFPARLCLARGWTIALRVVTSWLLAVAMLVGAIPHLVIHPGYVPDHRV